MKTLIKFLAVACAVLLASRFIPGITVDAFWPTAVIAAAVLGALNIFVRPVLAILTLPINLLTLGLFAFVVNALLFWFLDFLDGVVIEGFLAALLGSLVVTAVKWFTDLFLK